MTTLKMVKLIRNEIIAREGNRMIKKLLLTGLVFTFITGCATPTDNQIEKEPIPNELPEEQNDLNQEPFDDNLNDEELNNDNNGEPLDENNEKMNEVK